MEKARHAGDSKIEEYLKRISEGELVDDILNGLPPTFTKTLLERLSEQPSLIDETKNEEHPYIMEEEVVDFSWINPEIDDAEVSDIKNNINEAFSDVISNEEKLERRKLFDWTASYKLAEIAKKSGVDLSELTREEYVDFAIKNYCQISDTQLRMPPWQRNMTSPEDVIRGVREAKSKIDEKVEKDFSRFSFMMQQLAGTNNRYLFDNVRVRQGTKDSNSWLFFAINNGADTESSEMYKAYIAIDDINKLTPDKFKSFMIKLRDSGYNGDIKIFQDLTEQGTRLNDQIVMHGVSEKDSKLALDVAREFFENNLTQASLGRDEKRDGKMMSYSEVLADKIKNTIKNMP